MRNKKLKNCSCGCGKTFVVRLKKKINARTKCLCGCGELTSKEALFVHGHRTRCKRIKNLIKKNSIPVLYARGHNPNSRYGTKNYGWKISKSVKRAFREGRLVPMVGSKNPSTWNKVKMKMRQSAISRIKRDGLPKMSGNIKGYFYSKRLRRRVPFRSPLEKRYMVWLEKKSYNYLYEPLAIPYHYLGRIHIYNPDFVVLYKKAPWKVIEIKPLYIAKYLSGKNLAKVKEAYSFCQTYGLRYEVITEKWLEKRAA